MNTKWTLENIQKFLDDSNSNCQAISKEYKNNGYQNTLYVTLKTESGEFKKVIWNNFIHKKDKSLFLEEWNQDKAFSFCKNQGYFPLDISKFESVDKTFPCKDKNGFIYQVSITNLKRSIKEGIKFHKTRNNPYAVYNIKLFCKIFRPDYEFLDTEISKVRDKYKFRYNGPLLTDTPRIFYCTLDYFMNGNGGIIGQNISKEANIIAGLLRKNKINFSVEKTFDDLKSHKGKLLRFDFAIYDEENNLKCLIEYDSEIHFQRVNHFHKTNSEFKQAQERDRRKNKYCLINNIPLIRIPYWKLENLTYEKIFNTPSFLVKTKFHNDLLRPPN